MKILIQEKIGPYCIVQTDGQKIFSEIHEPLKSGVSVVLDFSGVRQVATPFLNFSIGQLLTDIDRPTIDRLLKVENLNETGMRTVLLVIENAVAYHRNPDYRLAVDNMLKSRARESD